MKTPETKEEMLARLEKLGYDRWIELWVAFGCMPSARDCPAIRIEDYDQRMAVIRGWNKAKGEYLS